MKSFSFDENSSLTKFSSVLAFVTCLACSSSTDTGTPAPSGGSAGTPSQASAGMGGAATSGGSGGASSGGALSAGTPGMPTAGSNVGGAAGGTPAASGGASGGTPSEAGAPSSGGSAGESVTGGSGGSLTSGGDGGMPGAGTGGGAGGPSEMRWVGTWATGPQLTEPQNLPPSPGLANNTLRQVLHVSIGGSRLRVRISNEYGNGPVTLNAVHLAKSMGASAIDVGSDTALTFSGMPSVTIPQGQAVWSDAFDFALAPLSNVTLTIHFGNVPSDVTGHPGSRTTSYLASGNTVTAPDMASAAKTDHWYYATGIDVMADSDAAAVVVLGDSITDGRGSTTNGNDRWPDFLAKRLVENPATSKIAVLNLGIGGNTVLSGGLGPTARARFDKDVLGQSGVKWLIVLEGVNDIGNSSGQGVAQGLIDAYKEFVMKARANGIRAYGVPILPFAGSQYDSPDHQAARDTVNAWIRMPGNFDAVIDLDAAVRDPQNPNRLAAAYDSGDQLHLNPAGYQKMGESVDLSLFTQ